MACFRLLHDDDDDDDIKRKKHTHSTVQYYHTDRRGKRETKGLKLIDLSNIVTTFFSA